MAKQQGRKDKRIDLQRIAGVSFQGNRRQLYPIHDISESGIFLNGHFKQNKGTPCSLSFTERWDGQIFVMKFTGTVARHSKTGIAIQFTKGAIKPYDLWQNILNDGSRKLLSVDKEIATAIT